jgi:DNA-binding response OmpR family regulator
MPAQSLGYADGVMSSTVDVHNQHLRKKLAGHLAPTIHTILGQGYVLKWNIPINWSIRT